MRKKFGPEFCFASVDCACFLLFHLLLYKKQGFKLQFYLYTWVYFTNTSIVAKINIELIFCDLAPVHKQTWIPKNIVINGCPLQCQNKSQQLTES